MASAKNTAKTAKIAKKTTRTAASVRREPYQKAAMTENYMGRVSAAFVFLFLACFTAVSYFVQEGKVILGIREFMSGVLGYGYYACAICFLWVAMILFKGSGRAGIRVASVLLIPVLFSAMVDVVFFSGPNGIDFGDLSNEVNILFEEGQKFKSGGVISGLLVGGMVALLSRLGTGIVIFILLIVCVALAVSEPDSWFAPQPKQQKKTEAARPAARFNPKDLFVMNDENPDEILFPEENEKSASDGTPKTSAGRKAAASSAAGPKTVSSAERSAGAGAKAEKPARAATAGTTRRSGRTAMADIPLAETDEEFENLGLHKPEPSSARQRAVKQGKEPASDRNDSLLPFEEERPLPLKPQPLPKVEPVLPEPEDEDPGMTMAESSAPVSTRKAASTAKDMKQPEKITKEDVEKEAKKMARSINASTDVVKYTYPQTSLLKRSKPAGADSRDEVYATRERLENALHSFGIFSSVVNITQGPTVTRYDIELEQGVKLTKVTNLSNDIALSLGVANVRIAPIPDEISTVGIEVPNKIVNTVGLRDIIESDAFINAKSKLTFAIGKDIAGNAICGNISKLPHLLIAGTTGSGKSVCMNSLIISLLYKSRPDEVKFIMVDPKMVELGIYNSIPHLYVPVVTDPKKAAGALQWAVVEMLKRYRLFSEAGVRDLETYNNYCRNNGEEPLPQMVIVIDELADLMMAASKEVEESICRIAQMGRASGQHLVIATQRPSADVITGLMKANIPSRIAFAVSSTLESRIILDQAGADKLIGHGDMLYAPIGCGKPLRVQGAFVSDEEREKIINFISKNSDPADSDNEDLRQFMDNAAEGKDKKDSSGDAGRQDNSIAGEYDEMLPQAAEVVLEMKQCSVSMLQRRLKLGYSRAARIVDQMEELGIVGPYEGAKPRSVPIDREGWQELQVKLGIASEDDFALAAGMNEDYDGEDSTDE